MGGIKRVMMEDKGVKGEREGKKVEKGGGEVKKSRYINKENSKRIEEEERKIWERMGEIGNKKKEDIEEEGIEGKKKEVIEDR